MAKVLEDGTAVGVSSLAGKAGADVVGKLVWELRRFFYLWRGLVGKDFGDCERVRWERPVCVVPGSWKGNGRFRVNFWAVASTLVSSVSPLRGKALTVSFRQVGKGIGQASRLTTFPGDAGAMPRMACVLVNGKGPGQLRQRA